MPQLPRHHDQLTAMVRLVRHEIAEEVREIGREVLPSGRRHDAAASRSETHQSSDPIAAPRQRAHELLRTDTAAINRAWGRNTMARTQRLDPHASRVVNMSGEHLNRPARTAGHT